MPPIITAALATAPFLLGAGTTHWSSYTVRQGDTLWDIASRHHTDVRTLIRTNHLDGGGHLIRIGTRLKVPGRAVAHRPAAPALGTYVVRSGDTVGQIALRYRVPPGTVLKLNHLDARGRIYPGQHLRVPLAAVRAQAKAAAAKAAALRFTTYTVRSGDTLSAIAAKSGTTLATVLKLNHLRVSTVIHPGQGLKVPRRAVTSSANSFAGRTYSSAVVRAAAANRHHLASRAVPGKDATRRMIVRTAQRYGVDPALALAVSWQESGWNQRQVSVANAIGTMQVIPSSGRWASELVGRRLNLLNTQDNITAGVAILRALTRSAATPNQAVAGYYQGLSSVQHNGMFADTKAYVRSINALAKRFG
ncbi:LysM peptidoglycan-binding domain-containing protein [Angustibacter sp. McL0619]|uniref:lytic transglycosylase domain-containing protein n=1 Tax=Angustibacter sp. McL0619 TaxID=3415676 RepID=UPI003CF2C566